MKELNPAIEYFFFKRSAIQFRSDLSEIGAIIDSLSEEQVFAVAAYMDSIKVKIKHIEHNLATKFLHDSDLNK